MNSRFSSLARWLCFSAFFAGIVGQGALCQSTQGPHLEPEDMRKFAIRLTQIQIAHDELTSLREFLSRDSLGVSDNAGNILSPSHLYSSLLSSEEVPVEAVALRDSVADTFGFDLWRCYRQSGPHSQSYLLAFGHEGSLFLLKGFGRDNFAKLLKVKVRTIHTKETAIWVAQLYLNTVLFVEGGYNIVTSNGNQAGNLPLEVQAPTCTKTESGFLVRLWVVRDRAQQSYVRHEFRISEGGRINHKVLNTTK